MKLKAFLIATVVAALTVSVAMAAPPPGKGKNHQKPNTPGAAAKPDKAPKCKGPSIILKGLYVSGSADASGVGSFVMDVKQANKHGKKLDLVGKQASVNVDAKTKIRRHGHAKLSDLLAGDRLNVKARMCAPPAQSSSSSSDSSGSTGSTSNASGPAAPALLARKIDAHPPKQSGGDDGSGTTTGTTSDTTTESTTTGTTSDTTTQSTTTSSSESG